MTVSNKNIISPSKLNKIINNDRLKIIDCRWYINDKKKGREEYYKGHIPGAIYFDLEKNSDLDNHIPHMLPKKEKFLSFLKKMELLLMMIQSYTIKVVFFAHQEFGLHLLITILKI